MNALRVGTLLGLLTGLACTSRPTGLTAKAVAEKRATCISSGGQSCAFHAGMLAAETLPGTAPVGSQIPIDHFVMIMHENRSFDHYFGDLQNGADVSPLSVTNDGPDGKPIQRFHQTDYCFSDTAHGWDEVHTEINDGQMNGFPRANVAGSDPTGRRSMGYYNRADLPFFYGLADNFAISDRHFCSVPGPTFPNRMFYLAGTSFGFNDNGIPPTTDPDGQVYPNIFRELSTAHVDWVEYAQDVPQALLFVETYAENQDHFAADTPCADGSCRNFIDDARNGRLPQVSFVEASDGSKTFPSPPDEHPPGDFQVGQQWLETIVRAVMSSPQWSRTAIIITYDEHGGLYDHVPPPPAVPPDDLAPATGPKAFNELGVRVPLVVISPYAKRGYVSHTVTDHTSLTRLLEARFNLPAMTRRDANAEPPYDLFDFAHPNTTVPELPRVTVEQDRLDECLRLHPQNSHL
jgi:phospholipase C